MSSLGIFNKETKTYQKVAGTAEAAVLDTAMSDTSENPVQNKVIKKYVDDKQVEVPIAGTGKAGIVKPADGFTVEEDGTLKVSLDGTTLTMDQVNNVIKLADTLKEKINGALPASNVVNNLTTTEAGFALDARQANPNIDGTLAKQVADLNGSLNRYPTKFSQTYPTDNESHTFLIEKLSLFFITYGNTQEADVYLCRCESEYAYVLAPLHSSSVISQMYEITLDIATRLVTITSKKSWIQVDGINI